MYFNKRRSPTLAGMCDFNNLHIGDDNTNVNTKNYLLSKPPMSFRDLRLVVTNRIPSNLLLTRKTSFNIPSLYSQQRIKEQKKFTKQTNYDVYRSLTRSLSHCSTNSERDLLNDDSTILTSSLAIDRLTPLSNTGYYRTNNLPKIHKTSEHNTIIRSTSAKISHRTTPTKQYYDENNEQIIPTTKIVSCIPKTRTRKQLHIYMPSVNC